MPAAGVTTTATAVPATARMPTASAEAVRRRMSTSAKSPGMTAAERLRMATATPEEPAR